MTVTSQCHLFSNIHKADPDSAQSVEEEVAEQVGGRRPHCEVAWSVYRSLWDWYLL